MKSLKISNHKRLYLDLIYVTVLILYPLRHIHWGIDFWDTGYNYANFTYMGLEHMDSMWLFSTYLSNAAGHFLTMLPGGGGLLGMNFYTGLFVSGLAAGGYFFCTRELGIPGWITFLGEMAAVSLCWCPTALLYNYVTYVLFTGCVMLLYIGLTREKRWCLFWAGVCLGSNVLVRFSNLPEAAMIVAVWAWDFIVWLEGKGRLKPAGMAGGAEAGNALDIPAKSGYMAVRHTLWCLGGYMTALAVMAGYIQVRYGMRAYVEGIRRLFAMTETATDYTAKAMIRGLIGSYVENFYWFGRIAAVAVIGIIGFAVVEKILLWTGSRPRKTIRLAMAVCGGIVVAVCAGWLCGRGFPMVQEYRMAMEEGKLFARMNWPERVGILILGGLICFVIIGFLRLAAGERTERIVWCACRVLWCGAAVFMLRWLYVRKFCSFEFYTYGAMEKPAVLFMMLAMLIGVVRIFHPGSPKEEKLISGMVVLVVLLTSIGSNNRVFPSINHLFVVAPYTLWECWRFVKSGRKWRPERVILVAFLSMFLFQSFGFGMGFVFAEATGVQNVTSVIENNSVLKHVRMNPERAEWMEGLSGYVNAQGLQGREVILFGQLPSLSYYLQMPSAFNPWSDLRSYSFETMQSDMAAVEEGMRTGSGERPVLILERNYVRDYELYLEGGEDLLTERGVDGNRRKWIAETERKYRLLKAFAERYNYDLTYENEKFIVME